MRSHRPIPTRSLRLALAAVAASALFSPACSLIVHDTGLPSLQFENASRPVPPGLTLSAPLRCAANDELRVEGLYIVGDGPGVLAKDNCEVWIVGSTLDLRGVALKVEGNGTVYLRDSTLRGSDAAFMVTGNGDVHANNSVLVGRREIAGNGELIDEGKNIFQ